MKKTVYENDFMQAFRNYDRMDNFTVGGLRALYDYIIELEDDCDIEIELDVIGICCEYTQYDSLEEFNDDYNEELETIEEIEDYTILIMINDTSFIIQNY